MKLIAETLEKQVFASRWAQPTGMQERLGVSGFYPLCLVDPDLLETLFRDEVVFRIKILDLA